VNESNDAHKEKLKMLTKQTSKNLQGQSLFCIISVDLKPVNQFAKKAISQST